MESYRDPGFLKLKLNDCQTGILMRDKILEIGSYPPPRTGWAMRIFYLKKALIECGVQCEVLHVGKNRKIASPDYISTFSGFDLVAKMIRYCFRGFTVHAHVNGDSPKGFVITFLGLFISWLFGKRPVLTFHAGPVQLYFPKFRAPLLTPYYKLIFALPRKIICNNQPVKDNIVSYGVNPDKVETIPAFSIQYLNFKEQELPENLQDIFKNGRPVISTYVYFRPEFFNEYLVDAMAELAKSYPDAQLIIMGGEVGYETIEKRAEDHGIRKSVHFIGDQDHDMFLTILKHSVCYLRTPVKDGVSTSVLESLYWGIPVVAAENGTRPPGITTYENKNIPDMVAKLKFAIENPEKIRQQIVRPVVENTIETEIKILTED